MQRVAFKMHLLPGKAQEYKMRHDLIWPELVTLLKQTGISDYYIYLDEDTNILLGTYMAADLNVISQLPENPVMQKWWQYMADIMESNSDHSPISSPLQEMFYLA
ncbi:L-rhamnose mutarotase [Mucilaginibacter lappiensis]|uniref:L-rhamnose mutarotase n=1 Tax=Mucilaginibacter lappiensis TaxID=354630 RepID=A0ABR6PC82_9SPHI|nr:L-rhamnose mutarotase [Mucilaginibacter lappiensis]MBB6107357.1 L-rhamnose mutarotase [Mucilaginibacter lappiensis]SIQ11181.1 L-rhamnose mutarotase [Mucilaginibacter lappiensis]